MIKNQRCVSSKDIKINVLSLDIVCQMEFIRSCTYTYNATLTIIFTPYLFEYYYIVWNMCTILHCTEWMCPFSAVPSRPHDIYCQVQTCNKFWRDLTSSSTILKKQSVDFSSISETWLKSPCDAVKNSANRTLPPFFNCQTFTRVRFAPMHLDRCALVYFYWRVWGIDEALLLWWRSPQGCSALELVTICSFKLAKQFRLFNCLLQERYENSFHKQ